MKMGSLALRIGFLLSLIGGRYCEITIEQVPFVSGMIGATVKLSCHLRIYNDNVTRANVYWLLYRPNDPKEYLFPSEQTRFHGRVQLSNEDDRKDMSVSLSKLQLRDTDFYTCFMSLLHGDKVQATSKSGSVTQLYVHGPIQMDYNGIEVICRIQVYTVENVTFIWYNGHKDRQYVREHPIQLQKANASYWIISKMKVRWDQYTVKENQTFTCLLQHNTGLKLTSQSMKIVWADYETGTNFTSFKGIQCTKNTSVSCQYEPRQPVLLYSLVLGNSLLILLIVSLRYHNKRRSWSLMKRQKVNMPDSSVF
ncbi:uncharacterized protein O3C94_013611 [Discoglossus pictus]